MANTINADNGVISGITGIRTTADNTGNLALQTNGNTVLTLNTSNAAVFAGSVTANSVVSTSTINAPNTFGFKNRIINGGMVIDQRNGGASVTPTTGQYLLDRWSALLTQASKYTVQQNAGSVTPPAGFINYLGVTSSSAYSVAAGDFFAIIQKIEGLNIADLAWGTASAKTVTLSFWVRSSLTGTFGGNLKNSAGNRSYPFTYTVSSANTWTQISITIPGDTTGTWLTTNGIGIEVDFGLGVGSTYSGAAGSWSANNYVSATGAVSVVGTNGATFYITGVQLEVGSQATSFDFRDYGRELIMCQRYYEKSFPIGTAPSVANYGANCRANHQGGAGGYTDGYSAYGFTFKVVKRTSATMTLYSAANTGQLVYLRNTGATVNGAYQDVIANDTVFFVTGDYTGSGGNTDIRSIRFDYTASAEL